MTFPRAGARRRNFVIVDTHFGDGRAFLAAGPHGAPIPRVASVCISCRRDRWIRWTIACRPRRSPLATLLADAWPMRVPGVHRLEFEAGRVVLTLAIGDDRATMLQKLWLRADAFNLRRRSRRRSAFALQSARAHRGRQRDGRAPTRHPIVAARAGSVPVSSADRRANGHAGHRPLRAALARAPPRTAAAPSRSRTRHAIVIGAGLAGCAVTARLAARGWRVTLIDRHAASRATHRAIRPACSIRSSGATTASPPASRARAFSTRCVAGPHSKTPVTTCCAARDGLLQIADTPDDARRHRRRHRALRLTVRRTPSRRRAPKHRVSPASTSRAAAGSFRAAVRSRPPRSARRNAPRRAPRSRAASATEVDAHRARRPTTGPPSIRPARRSRARRSSCSRTRTTRCGSRISTAQPTRGVRGQLTVLDHTPLDALRVPVIGEGYAVPLGAQRTLTGATYDIDDTDREIRAAGHRENLERVARMLPVRRRVDSADSTSKAASRFAA